MVGSRPGDRDAGAEHRYDQSGRSDVGERLPFADESVDGVFSGFVFRNLTSVDATLAEMERVLKPGKAAVVVDLTRPATLCCLGCIDWGPRLSCRWWACCSLGAPGEYWYLHRSLDSLPPPEEMYQGRGLVWKRFGEWASSASSTVPASANPTALLRRTASHMGQTPRRGHDPPSSRSCPRRRDDSDAAGGGRRLRSGNPTAPGNRHLGLLPSGPDPIHVVPPRGPGHQCHVSAADGCAPRRHANPQAGSSVPHEEGFGYRAPLVPHLARSQLRLPTADANRNADSWTRC